MATEIVMPKLGLTMESGAISAWLVEEGQEVQKGQALLEIATDKVTMEVEAQADGILRKILVPAGQEVPVSTRIGVIAAADEDIGSYAAAAPSDPVPAIANYELLPLLHRSTPAPAASPTPASPTPTPQAPVPATAPVAPTPVSLAPTADGRRPHKTSPKARKSSCRARSRPVRRQRQRSLGVGSSAPMCWPWSSRPGWLRLRPQQPRSPKG